METTSNLLISSHVVASMEGRMKDLLLTYSEQYTSALMESYEFTRKEFSTFLTMRILAADGVGNYRKKLVTALREARDVQPTTDKPTVLTTQPFVDELLYSWFGKHGWSNSAQQIFAEIEAIRQLLPAYTDRVKTLLKTSDLLIKALKGVTTEAEAKDVLSNVNKLNTPIVIIQLKTLRLFPLASKPYHEGTLAHYKTKTSQVYYVPTLVGSLPEPKTVRPLDPLNNIDLELATQTMGACQEIILLLTRELERNFIKRKQFGALNPIPKTEDLFLKLQTSSLLTDEEKDILNLYTDPAYLEQHVVFYLEGIQRYRKLLDLFRRAIYFSTREH